MLSTTQTEIGIGLICGLLAWVAVIIYSRPRPLTALLIVPPFAMVGVCVAITADIVLDARDGRAFDKITRTDTEQTIKAAFGEPDIVQPCGENLWWGYDGNYIDRNNGICIKQVRYNHFLSAWAVGYSVDGKVISKYHYISE